jgi:hypothetical protein
MYGCNDDDVFYATEPLHRLIQHLGLRKGAELTITKKEKTESGDVVRYSDGKAVEIFVVNGVDTDGAGLGIDQAPPTSAVFNPQLLPPENTVITNILNQQAELVGQIKTLETRIKALEPVEEELPF